MENEIIKTCGELEKISTCKNCGGVVRHGNCKWCHTNYEEFNHLMVKLKDLLRNANIDYDIFINLLGLKHLEEDFINEILAKNKDKITYELASELSKDKCENAIKLLHKKNCEYLVDVDTLFANLAKKHFQGKMSNLDDKLYISFLELYAKKIIEKTGIKNIMGHYVSILFLSDDEIKKYVKDSDNKKVCGTMITIKNIDYILLNQDVFLKNKNINPSSNIHTIYHELTHITQVHTYKDKDYFCYLGLLMAKDEVIEKFIPNYYDENYYILPTEANANYQADLVMIADLKASGIDSSAYQERVSTDFKLCLNSYRIINGQDANVHQIFDELIKNKPDISEYILKSYPIIGLEYNFVDGLLVRKTKEELEIAFKNETNQEIKYIYQILLESYTLPDHSNKK